MERNEGVESGIARILFAGTNSGCGKTTVTCAVLQALVNRGLRVGAFKCGPDYIDPMFHSRIIGAKAANLDSYFFDAQRIKGWNGDPPSKKSHYKSKSLPSLL